MNEFDPHKPYFRIKVEYCYDPKIQENSYGRSYVSTETEDIYDQKVNYLNVRSLATYLNKVIVMPKGSGVDINDINNKVKEKK